MDEEAKIDYVIVHKFKDQAELDQFALAMQWPEDRAKFKKLITPTNRSEVGMNED